MKTKIIFYFLALLLGLFNNIYAQNTEAEYLKLEQKRLEQAQKVEAEVETFIQLNKDSYELTDEIKKQILTSKSCSEKIPFSKTIQETLTKEELNNVFNEYKKQELRKLFFEENKDKEQFFIATPLNRTISCVNGGFENTPATTGYTFRTINPYVWNGINTIMPAGTVITTPIPTNNFAANVSIVNTTNPNEPFLASATPPIIVPKVLNGVRAIKLGATEIPQNDLDITSMTRQIFIDDNFMDVNFSLIMNNPGHGNTNFFRITVFDVNNNVVDRIYIESNPNNCLFNRRAIQGGDILYTNWVCARLNVGQIINQNATIEFMIADCGGGAHFSTVYIDDICGSNSNCTNPQFGSINLDPLNGGCPTFPLNVCGTYQLPPNSTLGTMELEILQGTTVVGTVTATPTITPTTFCFQVNATDFPSLSGQYEFRVNADFLIDCPAADFNWNVSDTSTNIGSDVDFDATISISNIQYNNGGEGITTWNNVASSYTVEVVSDGQCCSINVPNIPHIYYTFTTNNSFFNASQILNIIHQKCFRWRVKPNTSCGIWSEWCCISATDNPQYTNPHNAQGICHPNPPCSNGGEYNLTIIDNVPSGTTSIQNADGFLTAMNTIFSNSTVNYFAGNQIILKADTATGLNFWVKSGANFLARIQPCVEEAPVLNPRSSDKKATINESIETSSLIKVYKFDNIIQDYIKVYPNPAQYEVNVSTDKTLIESIEIIDQVGKRIKTIDNIQQYNVKVDISNINKGIYFLRIKTIEDGIYIEKVIIK